MDGGMTPAAGASDGVALDTYKRLFQEGRDLTASARELGKKHRRYYDGKLDAKLRAALRRKKQPDFTINRVRPGVEGMIGVIERGKSDPRAFPRTPQDEDGSAVATDALRYICDMNRWSRMKLDVARNVFVEGTAAVLTEVDDKLEIRFRRIRWEEFFYDPYSRELDFSDASYMGVAKWQNLDAVTALYPEHAEALTYACSNGDVDSTWGDRPDGNSSAWADPRRRRLLVVEMYRLAGGTWGKCVFVGDLKLEEGPSPYIDEWDKPCNPIEAQSAYIDDENNRYGVVADMVGPQDEINTYRRKAAHRATFRQVQESDPVAAYADPEEVRAEAAKPDGVIPPGYSIVADDKFSMDVALLQEAKGEIERIGPNPGILGRGNATSGRQDLVRQQAGLTELAHLYAGLDDLELRVLRQAWARARQWWTQPKFIRVTDNEQAVRFLQVNEPMWGPPGPVMDELTGLPKFDPVTRQLVMQPQFLGYKNELAKMGVDIIVENTPDTANVAQEQYNGLVELAKVGALDPRNPAARILIKASSLPKKRELLEELEASQGQNQGQPPPPSPEQQEAARLAIAKDAAGIEKTRADAEQSRAKAEQTRLQTRADMMRPLVAPQPGPITGF